MQFSVQYLPFIVTLVPLITTGITLILSLSSKQGIWYEAASNGSLPYISSTVQEGYVFAQGINLFWVLASLVLYVKYRQVNDILNRHDMKGMKTLNKITLRLGLVAAFGCSIIANIQQANLIYYYVHWLGVILAYGLGAVYQCMQTALYVKLRRIICQRKIIILRILISVISMSSFIIFFICGIIAYYCQRKEENDIVWQLDEGRLLHNISAVSEWISTLCSMVYLVLFYWEFRKITLYEPDVFVEEKLMGSENMQRTNEAFEEA